MCRTPQAFIADAGQPGRVSPKFFGGDLCPHKVRSSSPCRPAAASLVAGLFFVGAPEATGAQSESDFLQSLNGSDNAVQVAARSVIAAREPPRTTSFPMASMSCRRRLHHSCSDAAADCGDAGFHPSRRCVPPWPCEVVPSLKAKSDSTKA